MTVRTACPECNHITDAPVVDDCGEEYTCQACGIVFCLGCGHIFYRAFHVCETHTVKYHESTGCPDCHAEQHERSDNARPN